MFQIWELCTSKLLLSHHKLFEFVDIELMVIDMASCDLALCQSLHILYESGQTRMLNATSLEWGRHQTIRQSLQFGTCATSKMPSSSLNSV